MKVTLKKIKKADNYFGDRACAVHVSGVYQIVIDGEPVAIVKADGESKYFAAASWSAYTLDGERLFGSYANRTRVVDDVVRRFEQFGSVVLPESAIVRGNPNRKR